MSYWGPRPLMRRESRSEILAQGTLWSERSKLAFAATTGYTVVTFTAGDELPGEERHSPWPWLGTRLSGIQVQVDAGRRRWILGWSQTRIEAPQHTTLRHMFISGAALIADKRALAIRI